MSSNLIGKIINGQFRVESFVASGGLISSVTGTEGLPQYVMFVGLSLLLALVFLVVSVAIATANRRKSRSFGVAV